MDDDNDLKLGWLATVIAVVAAAIFVGLVAACIVVTLRWATGAYVS